MAMPDYKHILDLWCVRNGTSYSYEMSTTTSAGYLTHWCKLKVDNIVIVEYSPDEHEALENAIKNSVEHLIQDGRIDPEELHPIVEGHQEVRLIPPSYYVGPRKLPSTVFKGKRTFPKDDEALKPVNHFGDPPKSMQSTEKPKQNDTKSVIQNKEKMEESGEEGDASKYGWTIENAKGKLNEFLQANNMDTIYHYTVVKTECPLMFMAEKTIVIPPIGAISGQGVGNSKVLASKRCALSILNQLTRLGFIKPYAEEGKPKPKASALVQKLADTLKIQEEDETYGSGSSGENSRSVLDKDLKISLMENIMQLTSLPTHQLSLALSLISDIVELGKNNLLSNSITLGQVLKY